MRDLNAPRTGEGSGRIPRPLRPTGSSFTRRQGTPASLKPKPPAGQGARKPGEPAVHKPVFKFGKEAMQRAQEGPVKLPDLLKPPSTTDQPPLPSTEEEDEEGKGKKGVKKGPGGTVPGRGDRQKARNERAEQRKARAATQVKIVQGGRAVVEEEHPRRSRIRPKVKAKGPGTLQPKGKVILEPPITVRSLSEAIGIKTGDLLFKLLNQGMTPAPTINSTVDPQMAELIALEFGKEVEIKRIQDTEQKLYEELDKPDAPESLVPRAPIVTVMGHVDHGKTSLLDKIRKSNVVDTEAGGITQVIRAWRVEHGGKPITFLDTPGHEAFTKMRARGAQVTDIAVIVVAAEDGVMPQTEEAISHAKAAGVSLVVAINKVDLPNANVPRTRSQLYGLNVLPDNMGGDTPFVETSATTGKGIDELLDQLSIVAELKELKANPNKPGRGTCLEAMLSEGEGVRATVLVQQGTLRRGDVIVCGSCFGRVRQMYDDLGRPLLEAGPSVPARITGLDEVPDADDPFQVVPDLASARTIALKRKAKRIEAAQAKRVPLSLDQLTEAKIAELKIILKADFRGSIEAIRKELEKLHHEEVRVRVLEAAIGGITENDVWLALTSPEDTLIIGFNVVPDDRARALAEERGVQIRQYDIIYNLTKDLRDALEGKLKPREEVVHLGRAVVRETFKISRVGTIAGCYVTQGVIRRSAKIRLIREGVVIYPPTDRTASLESLKRFKDDASEVREGFECGIKIAGYDDVKVGDVIEAYRVEEVKRTL
jgi:translation initiation factor IF-2